MKIEMLLPLLACALFFSSCQEDNVRTRVVEREPDPAPSFPLFIPTALAQGDTGCSNPVSFLDGLFIPFEFPEGGRPDFAQPTAGGYIKVLVNDKGPDTMTVTVRGLSTGVYSIWMAESPGTGDLPGFHLADFQSETIDGQLEGTVTVITDIIDARIVVNVAAEDQDGIADLEPGHPLFPAGALRDKDGATRIAMDWVRIYQGEGDISIFASCEDGTGGAHAFSTTEALP